MKRKKLKTTRATINEAGNAPLRVAAGDEPQVTTSTPREQALTEAARIAMNCQVRGVLRSWSLDPADPFQVITDRPAWWMDPQQRALRSGLEGDEIQFVAYAVGLVLAGYRPGTPIPQTDDGAQHCLLQSTSMDWLRDPSELAGTSSTWAETAGGLLDTLWPVIDELATTVCTQTRLSLSVVRDTICPQTTAWLTPRAYYLAGRAVANHELGLTPTYLSIFNRDGHGVAFRSEAHPTRVKTMAEKAVLAYAGLHVALYATGHLVMDERDPDYIEVFRELPGGGAPLSPAQRALADAALSRIRAIASAHQDTIETLATLLLREQCLLGEEITFVLDGGAIEDWVRRYTSPRIPSPWGDGPSSIAPAPVTRSHDAAES